MKSTAELNVMTEASSRWIGWTAAVLTLVIGFAPFLILSLVSNTFWSGSRVSVPLSLSPSILIGDSQFITFFNSYAVPIFANALRPPLSTAKKQSVGIATIVSLLISIALNVSLHITWANDDYTGFIDPVRGSLSLGGKWHCAFASLELAFILDFIMICIFFNQDRVRIKPDEVLRAWKILLVYTLTPIADAVVMIVVVGRRLSDISTPDYFVLSSLILGLLLYAIFRWMFRS